MSTRAIATLIQIMRDPEYGTAVRIRACEGLLEYEAPIDAVELAKEFLTSVFENGELRVAERLDAIELMRKFEAPRVSRPTVRVDVKAERDRKEAWREYELGQLRTRLILKLRAVPPPGWDDILRSPDYLPPAEGWPPTTTNFNGMAEAVRERRAQMRVIEGSKPSKSP